MQSSGCEAGESSLIFGCRSMLSYYKYYSVNYCIHQSYLTGDILTSTIAIKVRLKLTTTRNKIQNIVNTNPDNAEKTVITDTNKIKDLLKGSNSANGYSEVGLVTHTNAEKTRGSNLWIERILSDQKLPGSDGKKGYKAYIEGTPSPGYCFFPLAAISSVEITKIYAEEPEKNDSHQSTHLSIILKKLED